MGSRVALTAYKSFLPSPKALFEKLKAVVERIEAYAVFEPLNDEVDRVLASYCKLDLLEGIPGCPGIPRQFIKSSDGPLRFRDHASRLDAYLYLFSDLLLVTKLSRRVDKVKVSITGIWQKQKRKR